MTRWRLGGARFLGIIICLSAITAPAFSGSKGVVQDVTLVLEDRVLDLRANPHIRGSSGMGIGDYASIEDLEVGSLFLSADGTALKVVAIKKSGEETIIETVQPDIREVIAECYMPDQEIRFTVDNILPESIQDGVVIIPDAPGAQSAGRLGSLAQGPTWIDTDTNENVQGNSVITVSVDKTFSMEKSGTAFGILTGTIEGELGIKGQLRISNPILKGGLKMPAIHVRWVTVWWYIGYPAVSFETGYLHASFDSAEQIDCKITGTVTLGIEVKIPLYALLASDPSGTFSFLIGVYLKVSMEGSVTLGFEICEYARLGIWGSVDLVWPFIPVDLSAGSDFYYNFAVRPSFEGWEENKAGPYLGLEGTIAGTTILSAEIGGGIYTRVEGYIEAADVIGLDKNVGGYGSWAHWTYSGKAEVGGYLEATLGIADVWSTTLLDKRWPFLQIEGEGEF